MQLNRNYLLLAVSLALSCSCSQKNLASQGALTQVVVCLGGSVDSIQGVNWPKGGTLYREYCALAEVGVRYELTIRLPSGRGLAFTTRAIFMDQVQSRVSRITVTPFEELMPLDRCLHEVYLLGIALGTEEHLLGSVEDQRRKLTESEGERIYNRVILEPNVELFIELKQHPNMSGYYGTCEFFMAGAQKEGQKR
jgi:hypothetical protein